DIDALADLDRRHQRRVRTDERAGPDLGVVLVETVIVAGDGAGADVGVGANMRIPEIGNMIGLGAGLDRGRLDLDEIADVDAFAEHRTRPQPRIRTDAGVLAYRGL